MLQLKRFNDVSHRCPAFDAQNNSTKFRPVLKKHLRRSESADDTGTVEKRGHPHLRAHLACIKSLVHVDVYAYVSFGDSDAKAVLNERIKIC